MKLFILSVLICIFSNCVVSQNFDLLGIVDDQLIKINSSTNAIDIIGNLNPSPPDDIRFLTLVEDDCLIYGILNSGTNPTLVSIDMDLNFTVIGELFMSGGSIYFSEGLSYNNIDNTLYAAVSQNGNQAGGDYYSESLVVVNRASAECLYKSKVVGNVNDPDMDRITFCGNELFFYDGQPGQFGKFFGFNFSSIGITFQADELGSEAYIRLVSLECLYGNIYYSLGRNLSFFNTSTNSLEYLGSLFESTDFGGAEISGLCRNPFPDYLSLGDDVSICNENEYLLELDYPYSNVTWNDGSTSNSILISMSGLYWADVEYNNCTFRTDTIEVSVFLTEIVSLGTDTVICQGETLTFEIPDQDALVNWSDGSSGGEINISESGSYWAVYEIDGCIYHTDSIDVEVVENIYSIGEDIILCGGENHTISIEGLGQNISWNNGYTGNNLVINEPGTYWAEITLEGCELYTDTIEVSVVEPLDIFIGSHMSICEGENLTIVIDEPNIDIVWNNGVVGNELVISEAGLYWAVYIVEGCIFTTDTIFIEVVNNIYDLGEDIIICEGETHTFELGGVEEVVIWSNGQIGNQLIVSEAGEYWAEVELANCQFITNVVNVSIVLNQFIDIGSDILLCGEEEVNLIISNNNSNMLWSTGEIANSITVKEDGLFWVSSVNQECPSESDTIEVRFIEEPIIEYDFDTLLCIGEELEFSTSLYDISWSNNEGENLTSLNETGSYWGSYQKDECRFETDTLWAKFVDCTPCEYYMPNIISPNSDGINDEFKVKFSESCVLLDIEVFIYDRWGNLIAKSEENIWNGEFNFKPVENGVYGYSITMNILKYNGDIQEMSILGDITVIK